MILNDELESMLMYAPTICLEGQRKTKKIVKYRDFIVLNGRHENF